MELRVPENALVVLLGAVDPAFAGRAFAPGEVLSAEVCRSLVGDEADGREILELAVARRLARGRLTVVEAPADRARLVSIAKKHHVLPVAIWFGPNAPDLAGEGFRIACTLAGEEAAVVRERLPVDRREDRGPFDVIGDVHGCYDELVELLEKLGWRNLTPRAGRKAIFLGDLNDRGPRTPDVLELAMGMVEAGTALCLPGNHDEKLAKKLAGRNVSVGEGLAGTLEQLAGRPPEFRERVRRFLESLPSHYLLDEGRLVVAHAGLKEHHHGRDDRRIRDFAIYGDATGEKDEFGLPIRRDWAAEYGGQAMVVYGHTPVEEARWVNRTINIDTGCVFGGRLTALRYPELELVSVAAKQVHCDHPWRRRL